MNIKYAINGDVARLVPSGTIDEIGAEKLKSSLEKLDLHKIKKIELDFRSVPFIGSAGIGRLLALYRAVAPNGGSVVIFNVSPDIYNIFRSTKLTEVFEVHASQG